MDFTGQPEWRLYDADVLNNNENLVQDSVVVEYNDIQGFDILYYIRDESIVMDQLYGESVNTGYLEPYSTRMTYEITEEPTVTDSFGVTSIDVIQYGWIPITTFTRDVSAGFDPKPGDVIKTLWNERSYEVADVGKEGSIFQLNKNVYEFILKPYRFSDQSESAGEASYDIDGTLTEPLSAFGENQYFEDQSEAIDDYDDVDTTVYGY